MNARPTFLKWSSAVFVVLLPFLAYSMWDAVEAARLRSRLQAVVRPGYRQATGDAALAERYYRAATALVSYDDPDASIEVANRMWSAVRGRAEWTPDTLAAGRRRIDRNREALDFVDRAAALPHASSGYVRYTGYAGQLFRLARLCELRAMVKATDGDSNGAVASLYSEVRLARALDDAFDSPGSWAGMPEFAGIARVLDRAKPEASSLTPLSAGLAELDRDDRMTKELLRIRLAMLNDSRSPSVLPGALLSHLTVSSLDAFDELVAASGKPWPERFTAILAVGHWPLPTLWARYGDRGAVILQAYAKGSAEQVMRMRCARLAVDPRLTLVDPFTGQNLAQAACKS